MGKARNGKSKSVNESKAQGYFILELEANPSTLVFSDSVVGTIETAFIEKSWKYSGGFNEEVYVSDQMCQIVVRFTDTLDIHGTYIVDWCIWSSNEKIDLTPINSPLKALVAYLDAVPTDTLTFNYVRFGDFVDGKKEVLEERELFSLYPK